MKQAITFSMVTRFCLCVQAVCIATLLAPDATAAEDRRVRCWNPYMLGIEHEGFANNPAWYTEAQYQASAQLTSPVWQELVVVTATSDMASFEVYPGSEAGQRFYRLLLD